MSSTKSNSTSSIARQNFGLDIPEHRRPKVNNVQQGLRSTKSLKEKVPSKSVLFVCNGNICRSPMAEAIFSYLLEQKRLEKEWKVNSAGLSPHQVGKLLDSRARDVLKAHNVDFMPIMAKQFEEKHFNEYKIILGVSDDIVEKLKKMCPKETSCTIGLLGNYHSKGPISIEDPMYDSGKKLFEVCYEICMDSLQSFLEKHEQ